MTPEQLGQRLGIPASQVTPIGLLDHHFPGVAQCFPDGPSRDAFVNGLGASLLRAGLDDSTDAGDSFRYDGQLTMIRHVLDQPEMQDMLARCRQQGGGGPTPTGNPPGGAGGAGGGSGPAPIGVGTVLLAVAVIGAVGGMLWWTIRRTPEEEAARRLPGRSNPGNPHNTKLSTDGPRGDSVTISGYEWSVGKLYLQTDPILFLGPKVVPGVARDPKKRWAEVFADSRNRPTVLIYRENEQGGEHLVTERIVAAGWEDPGLRDLAARLGFPSLAYAMGIAEGLVRGPKTEAGKVARKR